MRQDALALLEQGDAGVVRLLVGAVEPRGRRIRLAAGLAVGGVGALLDAVDKHPHLPPDADGTAALRAEVAAIVLLEAVAQVMGQMGDRFAKRMLAELDAQEVAA